MNFGIGYMGLNLIILLGKNHIPIVPIPIFKIFRVGILPIIPTVTHISFRKLVKNTG